MKKSDELLITIAEKRYEAELQHKDQINSFMSLPLGVLTILGSLFISSGDFLKDYGCKEVGWIFYIFLALFTILWLISLSLLIPCFFRRYQYFLTPDGWKEHRDDLEQYYIDNKIKFSDDMLYEDVKTGMLNQYIEYATINANANYIKSDFLTKAKILIIITVFSALPLLASQYYTKFSKEPSPNSIKISNVKDFIMTTDQNQQQKPAQKPPPPKPKPKPGMTINENLKPIPKAGKIVTSKKKPK